MAILVKDLYNQVAITTGFPLYSNETDTPDTTRFLIQCMSLALQSVIDALYISNNILERTDTIHTNEGQSLYGIEGMIKNLQIKDPLSGKCSRLPYLDQFNKDEEDANIQQGKPRGYVIKNGYLRLVPIPDDDYELKVTLSSEKLVWSNNDIAKIGIDSVEDTIMASQEFCNVVYLRACSTVFTRAQNANANVFNVLAKDRMRTLIERDTGTTEASRVWDRRAGHYNPEKGLLG